MTIILGLSFRTKELSISYLKEFLQVFDFEEQNVQDEIQKSALAALILAVKNEERFNLEFDEI